MKTYKKYVTAAWLVLSLLTTASITYSFLFGWIGGSVVYDLLHYSYHHGPDLPFAWYEHMKAAHMRHHYRDNSKEFGVTQPLWDHVFLSQRAKAKTG
jgi:sterol desaturase/sphingolipid hydroxylase (fatty acid hydroxylase superfamily)